MSRRKSDKRDGTPIKPLNNGDGMLTTPFTSDKNPLRGSPRESINKAVQMARDGSVPMDGRPILGTDHVNHIQGMVNEAIRGTPYEGKLKIVDIVPKETGPQPPFNPEHCLDTAIRISLYHLGGAIKDVMEQPVDQTAVHLGIVGEMARIMSCLAATRDRLKVGF